MNRLTLLVLFLILFVAGVASAQPRAIGGRNIILDDNAGNESYITTSLGGIGINMININPNACAILDLNSQTKGFLPPRMVPLEIAALCGGTPPEGLIVYNTHTHTLDIWNGSSWTGQWQTTGNTNLSMDNVDNLLGSTSISTVKPFNLIVGGTRIMRYEVNNRIQGGHPSNTVHSIAHGATIAGGGQLGNPNTISQHGLYSVIGGGRGNTANGTAGVGDAVVGGGSGNNAAAARSTIGGGFGNMAGSPASSILGGGNNTIAAAAQHGTIGGGSSNAIGTFGLYSTVAGGQNNTANGDGGAGDAFVGGGVNNLADGARTTVSGGFFNTALMNASTIGGGANNTTTINAQYATIAGGSSNTVDQYGGFVGGGLGNTASGVLSAVAAGYFNMASGPGSFVGGGGWNNAIAGGNIASGIASTIGGGFQNRATDDFGFVGGGQNNQAGNNAGPSNDRTFATVAGGQNNTASGQYASIGGGIGNTASGGRSVIAGGSDNTVSGGNSTVGGGGGNNVGGVLATIAGGNLNLASANNTTIAGGLQNSASGVLGFIGGGRGNTASGYGSTVAGGGDDGSLVGPNVASGAGSFIGGGRGNTASGGRATIAGGSDNLASGGNATVGGGGGNISSGFLSTVAGGNNNIANSDQSTIAGGLANVASAPGSFVGGGSFHTASNGNATIAGGTGNTASGLNTFIGSGQLNRATDDFGTIGGGQNNQAGNNAAPATDRTHATVSGGQSNTASGMQSFIGGGLGNNASGTRSTIGGGETNTALSTNDVVAGGRLNTASGSTSTVGGGNFNAASGSSATVAGGNSNTASGSTATVSGGSSNTASGDHATIAGGRNLTVGSYSFGFNADLGSAPNVSGQSNIAYFGNVDVLVGNTDNTAQQLRLYENNSSATLAGADFASFQAPAVMNATTQYALPVNYGTSGIAPYFLSDVTGVGSPRQLTWVSGNSSNWLLTGNSGSNPAVNFIGTTDAADFVIKTGVGAIERMRFDGNPQLNSSTDPLMTISNPIPNQQGLRINGTADAIPGLGGSTLAANPGVWDLVVVGDAVVTNVLKMGSSIWFDGINNPHNIKANQRFQIGTTTSNDLTFMTNNTERMYVDSTGKIGIGTKDPAAYLHIKAAVAGATPQALSWNGINNAFNEPSQHVAIIENTSSSNASGLGIVLRNQNPASPYVGDFSRPNFNNNYITFYNGFSKDSIVGRVEGMTQDNYLALYNELANNILDIGSAFDITKWLKINISYNSGWLDGLANFTAPSFPSITGGSICCYGIDWSGFSIDWPDISWPTLSGGSFGSLGDLPGYFGQIESPLLLGGVNAPGPFLEVDTDQLLGSFLGGTNALNGFGYTAMGIITDPFGSALKLGASFAFAGVTYESGSGDYAEWLERADYSEEIGIGDVVAVTGGKITKNTVGASHCMVVSWKPCVLGNMPEKGKEENFEKVAFMGQIPVKTTSSVAKGDYMVADGAHRGYAKAIKPSQVTSDMLGQVVGIAWEDAPAEGLKFVKIAVGLKPQEVIQVVQTQAQEIEALKAKVNEIDLLKQEMAELKEAVAASTSKVVSAKKSTKKPKFRYKTTTAK